MRREPAKPQHDARCNALRFFTLTGCTRHITLLLRDDRARCMRVSAQPSTRKRLVQLKRCVVETPGKNVGHRKLGARLSKRPCERVSFRDQQRACIVVFKSLPPDIILQVAGKMLLELEAQLAERDVHFTFSDAARSWIARKGFDKLYGARPMARLIDEEIKGKLVDELLFGALEKGGHVTVEVGDDDKLRFTYKANNAAEADAAGSDAAGSDAAGSDPTAN